ncbi:MAG: ABC transporter permease [Anaerolineaceae bacterium]|nr:ABC transporter permease [Anaerolineaceae bacterium]MDD4042928.1 ABC transporter permease [Anaerolineaceae bacterium]MDD4577358.1 ABC transporter permease [Anaerolineaceae bacterium]
MTQTQTTTENDSWDLIITPRKKWWDLQLRDVWHYRDLIILFVRRDFVSRYKQTILGPLWFIIQPLFTSLIYTVIFGQIAKLPTDGLPQMLFYMSGTVMWHYFSGCLNGTSTTFTSNAGIFGKVYFPRLVTPISIVISNLISFAIQLVFFLGFFLYFYLRGSLVFFTAWALTLPLLIVLMAGLGLGFGIIISSLTTKYRDLSYLVGFGVGLWMYATPVIYPVSTIPERWRWIADINPISPIIETFRAGFLGAGAASWMGLVYSFVFMLVVLLIGVVIFNRVEKTFIDTV